MQYELIRLKEELGITFVYVTHDQEEALTMSDTIVVMNQDISSRSVLRKTFTTNRKTHLLPILSDTAISLTES